MPHPEPLHYRTPHDEPAPAPEPREELGRVTAPVLGDLGATLLLGRPLHLALDRQALDLRAGGLELRAEGLPTISLRGLHVDLVDGVVETDADAIGPAFDRLLTVGLCSASRHLLGWTPGSASLLDRGLARLPLVGEAGARLLWRRRGLRAAVDPGAALTLELRGDAVTLELTRPLLLRLFGLGLAVTSIRYLFGAQRLEVRPATLGPLRRALLRLAAWFTTRWLRARLPPAMAAPGYDLFADPDRRAHLAALAANLRHAPSDMSESTWPEEPGEPATQQPDPHALARAPAGGPAGLFSATKAALVAALATLRVSADDIPPRTRALFRAPLGPFSSLALCADRGDEVIVVKRAGGLRLECSRGLYLYADQFPELAELRLKRVHVDLGEPLGVDVQTEPSLGPFLRALVQRAVARHLLPRLPTDRLKRGGLIAPPGRQPRHVLWQQPLGADRRIVLDTEAGGDVELHHREDALLLLAPAGLSLRFEGLKILPDATLHRVVYRWDSGALEIEGDPPLGPFGQQVLGALTRVRVVPLAPRGLGLPDRTAPPLAGPAHRTALLVDVRLPVVGHLQLRMDPADPLAVTLGPTSLSATSERALQLAAPDLGLTLELRAARYTLPDRALTIDASAPPGDYLRDLSARAIDLYLIPLLRKAVPLWPDARADQPWSIGHVLRSSLAERLGLALDLSLPPGADLTARRLPDALELRASAPLQVRPPEGAPLGEFSIAAIHWEPEGGRVSLSTSPPAGPLLHALVRHLHAHLVPRALVDALTARLALPAATPPPPAPPAPSRPAVATFALPAVGELALYADATRPLHLDLRRDGACLGLSAGEPDPTAGLVVRLADLDVQVALRGAALTFLPFTLDLASQPAAGELEQWLLGHALRDMFSKTMRWFWPTDRTHGADHDTLLAFAREQPWGPLEVAVDRGGELELLLDREALVVRSSAGLSLAGPTAARWLPTFAVHELAYGLADAAIRLRVAGIAETHYREPTPVGPSTEALLGHLVRMFALPHAPAWAQRLGLRILPPPPAPPPDPTRVPVLEAQLPGGHAKVALAMDPRDVLALRADRREISLGSARHLHLDIPGLHLRLELSGARYHLESGEVQIAGFGQLEAAIAESVLRRVFTTYEPSAAREPDTSALAAALARFPVDDHGRRVLYTSKLARVLLRPTTALLVRLDEEGLVVTADPPLDIDGPSVLDYRFGGLRYSFSDAAFHLDLERDGVLAGALRGLIVEEGENQLDSLLRPLLPAAMRTPGYRLADDPDPRATITALVRSTIGGALALTP